MKLRLAVSAVALLTVSACSSSDSPAALESAGAAPTNGATFPDSTYLELVRSNTQWWDTVDDAKVLTNSRSTCDVLSGASTDSQFLDRYLAMVASLTGDGATPRESGAYITYAASQYCPDQVVRLNKLPAA